MMRLYYQAKGTDLADVVKLLDLLILSQKEDAPRYDEPRQIKLLKQTPKIPLLTLKKEATMSSTAARK